MQTRIPVNGPGVWIGLIPARTTAGWSHLSRSTPVSSFSTKPVGRATVVVAPALSVSRSGSSETSSDTFEHFILDTQKKIIDAAETLDGSGQSFRHDRWDRNPGHPNAGYGITSVLEGGKVLEKAAVNISVIGGVLTAERARAMSSRGRASIDSNGGQSYAAAALSLVFHSAHPMIPTLRADVRLFEVDGRRWYGGGADLTPFYLVEDDVIAFHRYWKELCDRHDSSLYPVFKEWCDSYFYLPARKEHRGVGGIFFDDLDAAAEDYDVDKFVRDVALGILPSWEPIVKKHKDEPVSQEQREWQLLRRGRYLEFNLLYDRGVKFGLDGGRIESIMVSAPPLVSWKYNIVPEEGSPESNLLDVLKTPRSWV